MLFCRIIVWLASEKKHTWEVAVENRIPVQPLGLVEKTADLLLWPFAKYSRELRGLDDESPPRTHFWNNVRLAEEEVAHLNPYKMVKYVGNPQARPLNGFWRHLRWNHFVVVEPVATSEVKWHLGWISDKDIGVSRIVLQGEGRCLIGPSNGQVFGLDLLGQQICIQEVGLGVLGDRKYPDVPLL